jgi:radical SAM protein with 4Fe4S-binding SPASM domain
MQLPGWLAELKNQFTGQALAPGLYHFDLQQDGGRVRTHLRMESDGCGTIFLNANRILHLNPSAALMAYGYLSGQTENQVLHTVQRSYPVSRATAGSDYAQFKRQLDSLIFPDQACPVCDLDVEINAPFTNRPSAPYRMDLALTYRCNNDCAHCYNISNRQDPELSTRQWQDIIDQLWQVGIPHIVFTGGEPTLRDDLPELIAHAEANGQITGVNTNGRRLSDPVYLQSLVDAGLDHIQITLESHEADVHDRMVCRRGAWKQTIAGIQNAVASRLFVMTNTTLLQENAPYLADTLNFLNDIGVPTVGLNALIYSGRGATVGTGLKEAQLPALLDLAAELTTRHDQRMIWYTPTQYCNFDPVQMELGVKSCTAALYNMCIEPDGTVLPCQSYYRGVGNITPDTWQSIWEHELCLWLRNRQYVPEKCHDCSLLQECGGGCPLQLEYSPANSQFIPASTLTA